VFDGPTSPSYHSPLLMTEDEAVRQKATTDFLMAAKSGTPSRPTTAQPVDFAVAEPADELLVRFVLRSAYSNGSSAAHARPAPAMPGSTSFEGTLNEMKVNMLGHFMVYNSREFRQRIPRASRPVRDELAELAAICSSATCRTISPAEYETLYLARSDEAFQWRYSFSDKVLVRVFKLLHSAVEGTEPSSKLHVADLQELPKRVQPSESLGSSLGGPMGNTTNALNLAAGNAFVEDDPFAVATAAAAQLEFSADEALLAELIGQGDSVMAKLDEVLLTTPAAGEGCQLPAMGGEDSQLPAMEEAVVMDTLTVLTEAVSSEIAEFSVPPSEMSARELQAPSQPSRGKIRAKARQQVLLASQDDRLRLALSKAKVLRALDDCIIKEDLLIDAASGAPLTELVAAPIATPADEESDRANLTQTVSPQGGKSLPPSEGARYSPVLGEERPSLGQSDVVHLSPKSAPPAEACADGNVDVVAEDVEPWSRAEPTADAEERHIVVAVDEAAMDTYIRDPSCLQSATTPGREQQTWAANVLGTLAKETPTKSAHKKKKGLKRSSTYSILRELGCEQVKHSPTIDGNSMFGQQSSNSIRSQLTSPADSDWMFRSTWTPPSPPAPSSSRTERTEHADPSTQRVPNLLSMPATGLRVSPCNSATSQKAMAAHFARSGVPDLDMTRVNMGYDDDEDTEDDKTGCNHGMGGAHGGDQYLSSSNQ